MYSNYSFLFPFEWCPTLFAKMIGEWKKFRLSLLVKLEYIDSQLIVDAIYVIPFWKVKTTKYTFLMQSLFLPNTMYTNASIQGLNA